MESQSKSLLNSSQLFNCVESVQECCVGEQEEIYITEFSPPLRDNEVLHDRYVCMVCRHI